MCMGVGISGVPRLVAYGRASIARQGLSGLGPEARRRAKDEFAASRAADVLAYFTEVESGRKAGQPELAKAVHLAKVTGAVLVIVQLERLFRIAAVLLAFRSTGMRFVAIDMRRTMISPLASLQW